LKGAKFRDLEDVLVIWMGQVNETDEVVKEQAKVAGQQQMGVTNFVYKNWYVFCFTK
jgi:hypothetical protein